MVPNEPFQTTVLELAEAYYEAALNEFKDPEVAALVSETLLERALHGQRK